MRAGDLRDRVTLQYLDIVLDSLGAVSKDSEWKDIGTVWADVRYVSGREFTKNGLDSSSSVVSVKVRKDRYSSQVTTECRLIHEGNKLNITAVLPDRVTRESITFVCSQGENEGK